MDLTLVAQMLADGEEPELLGLQQEQYRIMAEDYSRLNVGAHFPLVKFAGHVYQMRLNDSDSISGEFAIEIQIMERHKMVVSRHYTDAGDKPTTAWYFRHERIADFFIVKTFMGTDNERPAAHLADPRFRGVYLLLATLLPVEEAQELREHLIQYTADTRDHSVSDDFIQLLRTRGPEGRTVGGGSLTSGPLGSKIGPRNCTQDIE